MPLIKRVGVAIVIGMLAGCQSVRSDVTRFHQLPVNGDGSTIFLGPVESSLTGTIEFQTYAAMVGQKLQAAGYRPVASIRDAKLVALLDYGVVGHTRETGVLPTYGQTGGGFSTFTGQVGPAIGGQPFSGTVYTPPTYGQTGAIPYSKDTYHRRLEVSIYRFNPADPKNSQQLFSGTVNSRGSSGAFNQVAGCLVEALFKEFPGKSGKTETVDVDLGKCKG